MNKTTDSSSCADDVYASLGRDILSRGRPSEDRTGVGTISLFGATSQYDLTRFPLMTTKFVSLRLVLTELLWFISGDTNIRSLLENRCHIWSAWPHKAYVEATNQAGLSLEEFEDRIMRFPAFAAQWGELGPVYGKQWRNWEGPNETSIDQLALVIETLRSRPYDRGIVMSGWNAADLGSMALRPCHTLYQWRGHADGTLDCVLYQRSGDYFLGVPFNIASASALTLMIAAQTGLKPGRLTHHFGDVHIYRNHLEQVEEQLSRAPFASPSLKLDPADSINDYTLGHFHLEGYQHHPALKGAVAV